jgi:asparagine synthase (glutamine-hydrolysing)
MCGFTGVLNLDRAPASPVILQRMTSAIAHRGPDGEGVYTDGPIGLGHRRLAVIDPSPAGRQPMATADGRFVLAFNGEIYNYQALRPQLEARGYRFRSSSDTEVLLYALAAWGEAALDRINGMFSLAFWDRQRSELLLARDRYGIKPLYIATNGERVVFGSEVKALLAHPDISVDLDTEALLEYFTFQNLFTNRTFFKGISMVRAGELRRFRVGEPGETLRQYWDFDFREPEHRASDGEYVEELDRLFRQAVTRQLVSDVPVGSYLSGGMDSASITAVAASQIPDLRTFTVGFDLHSASGIEIAFDERERSELLSYLLSTEHYEMVLKAGDMERVMQRLIHHQEVPRVGQCYPNFYAAQLASKFGKVVLSGTGGDELFGGYPWRYYRAVVNDSFENYVDKYYLYWQRLVPNKMLQALFAPVRGEVSNVWTRDIFRSVFPPNAGRLTSPQDYINHSLYLEAKTFLHGLLVVEDQLSMAHGLETRVPFLDNDLVEFAQQVPVDLKLGNLGEVVRLNENEPGPKAAQYYQRSNDGKLVLRQALSRLLPAEITSAEKQGFSAPDASWFRGESMDYVRRRIWDDRSPIYEVLDPRVVRDLVVEHLDGRQNRRLLIWSLLSFDEWCRCFLGGRDHSQVAGAQLAEVVG